MDVDEWMKQFDDGYEPSDPSQRLDWPETILLYIASLILLGSSLAAFVWEFTR